MLLECRLLALGILEYNSDWKAIKQRFLPCKGEHQVIITDFCRTNIGFLGLRSKQLVLVRLLSLSYFSLGLFRLQPVKYIDNSVKDFRIQQMK